MEKQIDVKIQKYEITKLIFAILGASFLVGATVSIPVLPFAIGTLIKAINSLKSDKIPERKIKRSLISLNERNVLSFEEIGENIFVRVNDGWRNKVIEYSLVRIFSFKKSDHWNGQWYAVFFDVPEIQRNKRNKMRKLLKMLGFFKYQQSVYIFPYECVTEIALIKQIVEGGSYLKYAVINKIEGEKELKSYFGLS